MNKATGILDVENENLAKLERMSDFSQYNNKNIIDRFSDEFHPYYNYIMPIFYVTAIADQCGFQHASIRNE